MINKISVLGYNINKHLSNRVLIPYSTTVGIQSIVTFNYSLVVHDVSSMVFSYNADWTQSLLSSSLNIHTAIGEATQNENIIVRKNDAD